MDNVFQGVNFYYFVIGLLGLIVILRIRQHAMSKSRFYKEWGALADETGLDLSSDSLRSPFGKIGPEISGYYHGKEVKVAASYLGVFGRHQALFNFNLLIENPSTDKLPAGAFLVIRRNPHVYGFWHRLRRSLMGKQEELPDLKERYQIHGVPRNIGNFVFRQESTEKLIQVPGMLDLHIDRKNLSYSLIGNIDDRGFLQQILDNLRDLAVSFERFAKNWL
jgi:hypothetical protein